MRKSLSLLGIALGLLTCAVAAPLAAQDPDYIFDLHDGAVAPGADVSLTNYVTNTGGNVSGFSFGVCSDPNLVEPFDYTLLPALTAFNGGSGPSFFSAIVETDGFGCGTVLNLFGLEFLPPVSATPLITIHYHTFPTTETSTNVAFCDTVGTPDLATIVVVQNGDSVLPTTDDATIEFISGPLFSRGDPNQDGSLNIADAITVLNYLFANGTGLCLVSMDANGDQTVDIADALYIFAYLNGFGPAPLPPFPDCGVDSTGSTLPCDSPPSCP